MAMKNFPIRGIDLNYRIILLQGHNEDIVHVERGILRLWISVKAKSRQTSQSDIPFQRPIDRIVGADIKDEDESCWSSRECAILDTTILNDGSRVRLIWANKNRVRLSSKILFSGKNFDRICWIFHVHYRQITRWSVGDCACFNTREGILALEGYTSRISRGGKG